MEPRRLFERIDRDVPSYDLDAWKEEERQRRIARHEAFHRIANERAWQATESLETDEVRVFCECGHRDCTRMLLLRRDKVARLHARGDVFIITHGHELPDLERVIERTPDYVVVEKVGLGQLVALEAIADQTLEV